MEIAIRHLRVENKEQLEYELLNNYKGDIDYIEYLESQKKYWFEQLEKTSIEMFSPIYNLLNKYYFNVKLLLPIFPIKNIVIPNFFESPELHCNRVLDVKHDIESRINLLIMYGSEIDSLIDLNNKYLDILEMLGNYINKSWTCQNNIACCQIIINNEVEKRKILALVTIPRESPKEIPKQVKLNINPKTGIDLDLLKYLSDEFNVDDERFTELTKYNHIYFYLFPIPENDTKEQRAKHKSYKKLIHTEFGFNYGNSQIKVHDTETHIKQLNDLEYKFKQSTKL